MQGVLKVLYNIVRHLNNSTFIALNENNNTYILKKINLEEIEVYKKYMKINHNNVMKIYEFTVIDQDYYIVCEYINGLSLSYIVDNNGPIDGEIALKYFNDICDGLDAIHSMNLVHRDICPNNIMIDNNGRAVIVDFGISREHKFNKNADTQILGTQGYASPEQFGFNQTDNKSDIYSFGVLINYVLTGQMPNVKLCSGTFSRVVLKCTQIDKNLRYSDVREIKTDLHNKFNLYKIIKTIPGFRKGIWWHKLISSIYFLISFIIVVFSLFLDNYSTKERIMTSIFFFIWLFVDVLLFLNVFDWCDKVILTKNKPKIEQLIFRSILSFLIFIFDAIIFL